MAKSPGVITPGEVVEMFKLDLKNRKLAALLAWLFPGAGHLYQGRKAKGLLLMFCISTTFLFGFYLGGGKVAYASPKMFSDLAPSDGQPNEAPQLRRKRLIQILASGELMPFVFQAGIGSIAIPTIVERQRFLAGRGPLWPDGWFYPPRDADMDGLPYESFDSADPPQIVRHPNQLAMWRYDMGFGFEVGTLYTMVAGLLNILAIYDAYAGPLIPAPPEEENDGDGKGEAAKDQAKKKPADVVPS